MKKISLILMTILAAFGLCSCSGGTTGLFAQATPVPIPELNPVEILSAEDVYAALNYAYAPVLEGDTYVRDGNVVTATYRSEPMGQDPVIITISQYTSSVPKENIWYEYDYDRVKRPSAEAIEALGEDAFIAYPSIHVYDRGCHIQITAGSGDTPEQRDLLISLANTAAAKIEAIMPAEQQ